jgi:hypothetical protein
MGRYFILLKRGLAMLFFYVFIIISGYHELCKDAVH